jgi:hypothetical protein
MKIIPKIMCGTSLIFPLISCAIFNPNQPSFSPSLIKASPSPQILADCFLNFNISAWEDIDEDGLWGASEPALEGVKFNINGSFASILSEIPCTSDQVGRCSISTWAPGECLGGDFTITALPPDAYQPTTPSPLTISLVSTEFSGKAHFGFHTLAN